MGRTPRETYDRELVMALITCQPLDLQALFKHLLTEHGRDKAKRVMSRLFDYIEEEID